MAVASTGTETGIFPLIITASAGKASKICKRLATNRKQEHFSDKRMAAKSCINCPRILNKGRGKFFSFLSTGGRVFQTRHVRRPVTNSKIRFLVDGLRVEKEAAKNLFRGAKPMQLQESSTYMAILEEGEEKALKKTILRQGQKKFGPADETIKAKLAAITDLKRLEDLTDHLLKVSTWQELFAQQ